MIELSGVSYRLVCMSVSGVDGVVSNIAEPPLFVRAQYGGGGGGGQSAGLSGGSLERGIGGGERDQWRGEGSVKGRGIGGAERDQCSAGNV